jgi:hypothetical protein
MYSATEGSLPSGNLVEVFRALHLNLGAAFGSTSGTSGARKAAFLTSPNVTPILSEVERERDSVVEE